MNLPDLPPVWTSSGTSSAGQHDTMLVQTGHNPDAFGGPTRQFAIRVPSRLGIAVESDITNTLAHSW